MARETPPLASARAFIKRRDKTRLFAGGIEYAIDFKPRDITNDCFSLVSQIRAGGNGSYRGE